MLHRAGSWLGQHRPIGAALVIAIAAILLALLGSGRSSRAPWPPTPIPSETAQRSQNASQESATVGSQMLDPGATPTRPRAAGAPTVTLASESPTRSNDLACPRPIKIGLVSDLTSEFALYGHMIVRSFMLGMELAAGAPVQDGLFDLNGCQVEVIVRDDQGNLDLLEEVASELIEAEQVAILVGTVGSPGTARLQELAAAANRVHIAVPVGSGNPFPAKFERTTFRLGRTSHQDLMNLCQHLAGNARTLIQLAPDYPPGRESAAIAREACQATGSQFVTEDLFAPLDTDSFVPYVEKIRNSGAEGWILSWAGRGYSSLLAAAQEAGLLDNLVLGTIYFDNRSMQLLAERLIGQTGGILYHYTLPRNEINDWLVEQMGERYGEPPDLFDADGMNAALLAMNALGATGGDGSADALITAMEGMAFEGPKGPVTIRPEDHIAIQDMYIVTLNNVDGPENKFYQLETTTRPNPPCLLPAADQTRCGSLPLILTPGP